MNRQKIILSISAVVVAAIAVFWLLGKPVPEADFGNKAPPVIKRDKSAPIEIGLLTPLQGAEARKGDFLAKGAKLAEIFINKSGGISGRPLRLRTLDTRSNAGIAVDLTKELIHKGSVTAILGTISEESTTAVIDTLRGKNIPFIYVNDGLVKTCRNDDVLKVADFVWGLGLTPQMKTEPFLIYMADKLVEPETNFNIYYFGNETEQNIRETDFVIEIADSLGFANSGEEFVDLRIVDLFQRVRKIFGANPDLLFISTARSGTASFMQQAAKLGISSEMAVAGLESFEEEIIRTFPRAAQNLFTATRYSYLLENESNKAFVAEWKKLYPDSQPPTAIAAAGGYAGVMIIKAALEKAGDQSFKEVISAMENLVLDLPQGRISLSAQNHLLIQPLYAVQVDEGKFKIQDFLGDVSHPLLESCIITQNAEQELEQESPLN
jgi:ABC-type branched-subunit amino acid transport system substrate-binding protein